ncbi:4537_t:CDS:2 [Paraglomus occultum]|uniref:4537_t:CDS:1 n=1 Tax=Paraglomus occultum TaxID=144539 RepID=A0A9N9AGH0_9GLOM|nr:4537_t:CDS:2 [Paraglomus occultum]
MDTRESTVQTVAGLTRYDLVRPQNRVRNARHFLQLWPQTVVVGYNVDDQVPTPCVIFVRSREFMTNPRCGAVKSAETTHQIGQAWSEREVINHVLSVDSKTRLKGVIAVDTTPCLLKVPSTSQKFYDITRQFETAWKHTYKTLPEIHSIWRICCPENLIRRYNEYRDEVEKRQKLAEKPFPKGQGQRRVMTAGNEQRRFHGTSMKCLLNLLLSESQRVLCLDPQCSLCGIIRCGYSLKHAGTSAVSATFQRFGPGIYFSGTSSKSDDYNEGSATFYNGEKYKAMLLNKLIVGRGFTETKDNVQLTEPPPGYDSVLGEPRITSNLNYDEVVVYDERACLPKYLIIYKCPKTIALHKEPM